MDQMVVEGNTITHAPIYSALWSFLRLAVSAPPALNVYHYLAYVCITCMKNARELLLYLSKTHV